jgi:hypothetical protein
MIVIAAGVRAFGSFGMAKEKEINSNLSVLSLSPS